jgi:hypothetical protein
MTRVLPSLTAALFLIAAALPASAGGIHTDVPAKVDPTARYLIYIHGARPESFPLSEPQPHARPVRIPEYTERLCRQRF